MKDKLYEALKTEFEDVCSRMRSFNEFIDYLFFVLNQTSIPSLDGVDEMLKNTFNNVFTNENLRLVDKRMFFNTLVSKFEAYLKKLYYLINGTEVEPREAGRTPSLADAIHSFSCLWNLKYDQTETGQKFYRYLEILRQWRNDEAHIAPNAPEAEVNAAIKIVSAIYLYVTGYSITELEMAGY